MRIEKDTMGEMQIQDSALWGAQTQRAVENFRISGITFGRRFIKALGYVKLACVKANVELGLVERGIGEAIVAACTEVVAGKHDMQFPVDIFQTGSGTSTNMNANEVIANRTNEMLGGAIGTKTPVHPNDHVNSGQSSNDVMPTTIHVAASLAISGLLIPALRDMYFALKSKSVEFDHIVKTGRTHLQDAAPVRMGQVFGGFTAQSRKCIGRAHKCLDTLSEVALGGTAVGTGLNRHPDMPGIAINYLNEATGLKFKEALNHFEANSCRESMVEVSGELKTIAVSLHKIANDIRFMGSGPRNGLGELRLPAVQPGSSMMPGKVNPVMAEALIMAAAQVIGNDAAITVGGLGSYFELNMMMPLIGYNLITSIEILANAVFAFTQKCVEELEADEAHCRMLVEQSLALATPLVPVVGYEKAAEISKIAHLTGCTIKEVAIELNILPTPALEKLLDPVKMTEPGIISGDV